MANHSEKHTVAMLNHRKRMEQKQITSEVNADERAARSPQAQLALLDQRLGKDVGAEKERARLHGQILAAKAPKAEKAEKVAAKK